MYNNIAKTIHVKGGFNIKILNNIIPQNRIVVGIDIAKKNHVAVINNEVLNFKNSYSGFYKLITWINSFASDDCKIIIGMEPTAHYWRNLYYWIQENYSHIELQFVPCSKTKMMRGLRGNQRKKNDPNDARAIADLIELNGGFTIQKRSEIESEIQVLYRMKDDYMKEQYKWKNKIISVLDEIFPEFNMVFSDVCCNSAIGILKKYSTPKEIIDASVSEIIDEVKKYVKTGYKPNKIKQLKELASISVGVSNNCDIKKYKLIMFIDSYENCVKKIAEIESKAFELINQLDITKSLIAIDGISDKSICALIAELGDISKYNNYKQLIRFVGLDLTDNSSGNKHGIKRISKEGSRKGRAILYRIVLTLMSRNAAFKKLADYYRNRPKNPLTGKKLVICLCHKFLKVLHTMIKNNTQFDENKLLEGIIPLLKVA